MSCHGWSASLNVVRTRSGKIAAWLVCILLSATLIRCYNISERGFFQPDEASYLQIARANSIILAWIWDDLSGKWPADDERRGILLDQFSERRALPLSNYASKPLYHLLNLMAISVFGHTPTALLFTSAILGILTILLFYKIGKVVSDFEQLGCLAAGALAFSVLHAEYSRSGMPLATVVFFYSSGLYLYARSLQMDHPRVHLYLGGAGLAFGCTFLTHPNSLPFLGVVFFTELFIYWQGRNAMLLLKRCSIVYGLCIVPELIADLSVIALRAFIADDLHWLYTSSHLGTWKHYNRLQTNFELLMRLPGDMTGSYTSLKERVVTYVFYYPLGIEGIVYGGMAFGGFCLVLLRLLESKDPRQFLLVSCVVPYLFYIVIYKTAMPRSMACVLPYVSIFIGYAGMAIGEKVVRYRAAVLSALVVGFIGIRLGDLQTVNASQSGFEQGARWLREGGHDAVLGLNGYNMWLSHGIGGIASRAPTEHNGEIDTTAIGLEQASRLPYVSLWLDNYYTQEYKNTLATHFITGAEPAYAVEHITGAKRVACRNGLALMQTISSLPLVAEVGEWTGAQKYVGDAAEGGCAYPREWHVKLHANRIYRGNAEFQY